MISSLGKNNGSAGPQVLGLGKRSKDAKGYCYCRFYADAETLSTRWNISGAGQFAAQTTREGSLSGRLQSR